MNPHDDDDDFEDREYVPMSLSDEEIWLMHYLSQLLSENTVFDFSSLVSPQDTLRSLEHQDALVQGDAHPWALEQIMTSYHKHGG